MKVHGGPSFRVIEAYLHLREEHNIIGSSTRHSIAR
jgi:hypothetical protein